MKRTPLQKIISIAICFSIELGLIHITSPYFSLSTHNNLLQMFTFCLFSSILFWFGSNNIKQYLSQIIFDGTKLCGISFMLTGIGILLPTGYPPVAFIGLCFLILSDHYFKHY